MVEGPSSVHLTIGLQTLCGIDFLLWLAEQGAADVLLRKDVTRAGVTPGSTSWRGPRPDFMC